MEQIYSVLLDPLEINGFTTNCCCSDPTVTGVCIVTLIYRKISSFDLLVQWIYYCFLSKYIVNFLKMDFFVNCIDDYCILVHFILKSLTVLNAYFTSATNPKIGQ